MWSYLTIENAALTIGVGALGATAYTYYTFQKQNLEIAEKISKIEDDVKDLKIETQVFNEDNYSEEDLFEDNVKSLAEKLFVLLKTKHGMKQVTTYKEMTEELEELDADDKQMKEQLLNFYNSAIRMEYSDEELDEEEKQEMKKTAVDLIKKTGQGLEE